MLSMQFDVQRDEGRKYNADMFDRIPVWARKDLSKLQENPVWNAIPKCWVDPSYKLEEKCVVLFSHVDVSKTISEIVSDYMYLYSLMKRDCILCCYIHESFDEEKVFLCYRYYKREQIERFENSRQEMKEKQQQQQQEQNV